VKSKLGSIYSGLEKSQAGTHIEGQSRSWSCSWKGRAEGWEVQEDIFICGGGLNRQSGTPKATYFLIGKYHLTSSDVKIRRISVVSSCAKGATACRITVALEVRRLEISS
jgi:hypothetical protein